MHGEGVGAFDLGNQLGVLTNVCKPTKHPRSERHLASRALPDSEQVGSLEPSPIQQKKKINTTF